MVGELIALPFRVGVRATQFWLRAAGETVAVVADATGRLIDTVVTRNEAAPQSPPPRYESSASPTPTTPTRATAVAPRPVERDEPVHVSEEPELVEEIAEPGAEDGAGASVHVEEPWAGYEHMKADDVVDRLAGASPAELAAIELYESRHKRRITVLEAVERELRISTGSGSQS